MVLHLDSIINGSVNHLGALHTILSYHHSIHICATRHGFIIPIYAHSLIFEMTKTFVFFYFLQFVMSYFKIKLVNEKM